ncbi:hypothetical protein SKAU_G00232730 [Synaphobranchus kaupii]|uniref:Transposase n=1 Tax=Synaphobranchus kaupii TaxID=118154 RepID=A0A9Q1F5W9_SYNKA|nr:hypothetical protein SKAU_G00232730 [Synaphobranchus kaupii]
MESDSGKTVVQRRVKDNDPCITLTELLGKSEVLKKFLRVESDGAKTLYAVCKTCKVVLKYTTDSGTSGLQRHTCKPGGGVMQPKITSFVKRKVPVVIKSRLTNTIARMCSQDLRPFAVVEGQGFINVAKELLHIGAKYGASVEVGDVLPSARTVSRHVEEEYEKVKKYVMEEFQQHCIIINLFRDAKTLVTHFKRAGLQKALDRSLKQAVETRWNTRLAMLQSVRDALRSGKLHEVLLHRNELRYVNNIDPEILEDIIHLLEPFDEATRHLSTDQTPTLHLIVPTKATLLRGLLLQDGDRVIVKELKGKLAQAVELKFKIHLYHKIATALSPSLRCFLRKTLNAEEYEEVINTLAAITERAGTEESVRVEQDPGPMATEVHNFFASCVQEEEREEDSGDTIKESWGRQLVLKYMNEPTKAGSQSLLNFWQEMSGGLVPVARKLLAIPATSTPSERRFSVAGRLIEERRTTLNPENVDTLLFLHSNI